MGLAPAFVADLERRDVLRELTLGPENAARLQRAFYNAKAAEYRAVLGDLAARYGEPRQVRLSTEIRAELHREAARDARSVVATTNKLMRAEAARRRDLDPLALAGHLGAYVKERGVKRGPMIQRSELAPARLDAQVSFFRENGIEPMFDFVGPKPKCPVCRALKDRSPWPIEGVLAVGIPHIQCSHGWKARTTSAAKLKAGGPRPGRISAGRGRTAGIVGTDGVATKIGGTDEQAARAVHALAGAFAR